MLCFLYGHFDAARGPSPKQQYLGEACRLNFQPLGPLLDCGLSGTELRLRADSARAEPAPLLQLLLQQQKLEEY